MKIYLIIYYFLFLGIFLDYFKIKYREYYFKINIFILFIVSSLRYEVGPDYFSYRTLFLEALPITKINFEYILSKISSIEIGYILLESLVKTLTNNYQVLIILMNIMIFYFLYMGIKNYQNRNLQLFIFYCFFYLYYITSVYRQGLAMVILFYANKYSSSLKKYYSLCLLAVFFHRSALIIGIAIIFLNKKISKKFLMIVIILCLFFSYFNIIGWIILILNDYWGEIGVIRRLYRYYFIKNNGNFIQISLFAYFHRILILIMAIFFNNLNSSYIINSVYSYIGISFLFSKVGILAGRMGSIFMIYYLPFFSNIIGKTTKIKKSIVCVFVIILSTLYFYKTLISIHPIKKTYNYMPYRFILNK